MKITKQITVNASAENVWDVLGHKYDRVSEWASSVLESYGKPVTASTNKAPFAGRKCQTTLGGFNEDIVTYDEQKMKLAYSATGDKMPFFVKQLVNNWSITPVNANRSRIDMRLEMDLLPVFNLIMAPMMKMQMGKVLEESIEELKYFVETGKPHPRKLEMSTK